MALRYPRKWYPSFILMQSIYILTYAHDKKINFKADLLLYKDT